MTRNTKGKVAIISRESDNKTLDIAMLEAELRKRGISVIVLSKLLTKDRGIRSLSYAGHALRQEAAILSSDVVVLDTYCIPASMIPHRKGTKVVQIWHALGAVKKFGWQTVGMPGGSPERTARLMRMHHGYDYVTCASDITADHFCEAFRTDRSKIVKCGLPRIDYIKSVSSGERRNDMRRKIFSLYPELAGSTRKTVLYAPTFRRDEAVDVKSLVDALDRDNYNIVVRLHPLYRKDAEDEVLRSIRNDGCGAVIFDDAFSSFDWLSAADIIISDYSSLVIEAALADKPLYLYTYDLEDYEANNGLNMDFSAEPIAPYVFRNAKALAAAMDGEYDLSALRGFRDRYIDIDISDCTAAMAGFIEELIK